MLCKSPPNSNHENKVIQVTYQKHCNHYLPCTEKMSFFLSQIAIIIISRALVGFGPVVKETTLRKH